MEGSVVTVLDDRAGGCSCELERARTVDAELQLEPEPGRERWRGWTPALAALLDELAGGPVHVVVLTQPVTQRYVQLVVGHGEVRVEASSNAHLRGDRLTADDERRLASLGFVRPSATSPYWSLEEPVGLAEQLAELVAHTLVGILGFDPGAPLVVDRVGAERPCRACSWAA